MIMMNPKRFCVYSLSAAPMNQILVSLATDYKQTHCSLTLLSSTFYKPTNLQVKFHRSQHTWDTQSTGLQDQTTRVLFVVCSHGAKVSMVTDYKLVSCSRID
ncbi:hypothetical protein GDO81_021292 [Engystomops pustulosus]|uniref:Uncharacterized protein n=1 Tax=Engystomops pustulosus TaxID=76066 RepID=A0AAV6YVF3_ENGPU|nr:hypothetical protein GDO81_021292 [Engystomops pustulosus]